MTLRAAAFMTAAGVAVLVVGLIAHAQAAPIAFGAMMACLAGGIGSSVLDRRIP